MSNEDVAKSIKYPMCVLCASSLTTACYDLSERPFVHVRAHLEEMQTH